jgi:hypothetical protein
VLTATQIAAFFGVGLAGAAYVPQIWHLVRVHCSAGISRFAFFVWLGASLLVTTHAIATRAVVFILLGGVQIVATTVILICATKYASSYCVGHAPGDFGVDLTLGDGAGTGGPDDPSSPILAPDHVREPLAARPTGPQTRAHLELLRSDVDGAQADDHSGVPRPRLLRPSPVGRCLGRR